jgi:hypothetical protein
MESRRGKGNGATASRSGGAEAEELIGTTKGIMKKEATRRKEPTSNDTAAKALDANAEVTPDY